MWSENCRYIRNLCEYKLSDSHKADECISEVYTALVQALENKTEILNPKAWLTAVAKNKIIDFYNPDYIYGFKNMELDNKMEKIKPYDVCGLLEGTTGVCLSLLEGEKKSDNLWKKAFLLA